MLLVVSRILVMVFGLFLIGTGVFMLFSPKKARATIGKFGSTVFINYFEITARMVPAAALVIYADSSSFPTIFLTVGWFMLTTSIVLYLIPRRLHHAYSLQSMRMLKPVYLQLISPLAMLFGLFLLCAIR